MGISGFKSVLKRANFHVDGLLTDMSFCNMQVRHLSHSHTHKHHIPYIFNPLIFLLFIFSLGYLIILYIYKSTYHTTNILRIMA